MNHQDRNSQRATSQRWLSSAIGVGFLILLTACRPQDARIPPNKPGIRNDLGLMPVADLGVYIIVEDYEVALQGLAFVEDLGGYIYAISRDHLYGEERMIVELRPLEYAGLVAETLMTGFGEITSNNALAAEVSVRNARLRKELAELEASLGDLSGTRLTEAEAWLAQLHAMIAFQVERATYLFVTVSMVDSP